MRFVRTNYWILLFFAFQVGIRSVNHKFINSIPFYFISYAFHKFKNTVLHFIVDCPIYTSFREHFYGGVSIGIKI